MKKRKKWAVAVLSFFDSVNHVYIVRASSEQKAMVRALIEYNAEVRPESDPEDSGWKTWVNDMLDKTVPEIIAECNNGELGISKPVEIVSKKCK